MLASQKLGEQLGFKNIITADMGGTSFDVGLIVDGQPILATSREVGRFHVALPAIKVTAIGAGGGSIARIHAAVISWWAADSAGAEPGPACFGRGGTEPTITDADVVLGIIDPAYFLGGEMSIDVGLAERAILERIAEPLGMDLHEAAAGIREVANHQMADLLRRVTTWFGSRSAQFRDLRLWRRRSHPCLSFRVDRRHFDRDRPHDRVGPFRVRRCHRRSPPLFSLAFGQQTPPPFASASDHIDVPG